jgi:hypothetical protein
MLSERANPIMACHVEAVGESDAIERRAKERNARPAS